MVYNNKMTHNEANWWQMGESAGGDVSRLVHRVPQTIWIQMLRAESATCSMSVP